MKAVVCRHIPGSRVTRARTRGAARPFLVIPQSRGLLLYRSAAIKKIKQMPVPRFAANLAYLFTERPPIERFAAAAAAGFSAVELQVPYDLAPSVVKAELDRYRLTLLGINTAAGQGSAGEYGVAAVPGREREFAALFKQALDYVTAIGGCQIHCLAGKVPPEQRPPAEKGFIGNSPAPPDAPAAE